MGVTDVVFDEAQRTVLLVLKNMYDRGPNMYHALHAIANETDLVWSECRQAMNELYDMDAVELRTDGDYRGYGLNEEQYKDAQRVLEQYGEI